MKRLFFVVAIMMATTCAFAQHAPGSLTLQPRNGFSGADFSNTSDTKARVGMIVGPEFEYTMSNRFSLAFGLNYSQQGAEMDAKKTSLFPNNTTIKLDYLTVPIVANVYLLKGLALKAGIQPGFNLSAKLDVDGTKSDFKDDAVKKFDFAIPFGLSYEFFNIVLDAPTAREYSRAVDNRVKYLQVLNERGQQEIVTVTSLPIPYTEDVKHFVLSHIGSTTPMSVLYYISDTDVVPNEYEYHMKKVLGLDFDFVLEHKPDEQ